MTPAAPEGGYPSILAALVVSYEGMTQSREEPGLATQL